MPTPDTSTFTMLHNAMRADSARLERAVADLNEAQRTRRGRAIAKWYRGFRSELLAHHHVEDAIFMPALLERVPTLRADLARVDTDHDHLDDVLERARVMIDRLADPGVPLESARRAAARVTGELHALLQHHLDFEDTVIVPLFAEHFSHDEYEALDAQARKQMRVSVLTFTLPWIMDNANPDERQRLMDEAPLAFRLMWYATRTRYQRLVVAALDDADPLVPVAAG